MLTEASHQMRLQLYAGNSLLRWKGLVEWKRAHRAFFKLIISAWRMWAGAHKRATAVAVAAGSRHKVTALAQHFEILMQHTLYRRRLNAGAVLRIQTASLSGTRSAVQARRSAYMMLGASSHASQTHSFAAWKQHACGRRRLCRFKARLHDAHARLLLELIFVRWRLGIAKPVQEGDDGSGVASAVQAKLVSEWQESTAAFVWPISSEAMRELLETARAPPRVDAPPAQLLAYPPPPRPPPPPPPRMPIAMTLAAPVAAVAAAPEPAMGDDSSSVVESALMWQALAALAPAALSQAKARRAALKLPELEKLVAKRNQAMLLLPAGIASRRSSLLALTDLASNRATDVVRAAHRRDLRLLRIHDGADAAARINAANPKFTLAKRPGADDDKDDGVEGSGGKKGKKSGSNSARGRSAKGERSGSAKRARTPPPQAPISGKREEDDPSEYWDEPEPPPKLPPSVPRFSCGRERPPLNVLPLLPWEVELAGLDGGSQGRGAQPAPEIVGALSALRALASSYIENEGLEDTKEVFETAFNEAMAEAEAPSKLGIQSLLGLSSALNDASTWQPGDLLRKLKGDESEGDGYAPRSAADDDDDFAVEDDDDDDSQDGRSLETALTGAMAAVRMLALRSGQSVESLSMNGSIHPNETLIATDCH